MSHRVNTVEVKVCEKSSSPEPEPGRAAITGFGSSGRQLMCWGKGCLLKTHAGLGFGRSMPSASLSPRFRRETGLGSEGVREVSGVAVAAERGNLLHRLVGFRQEPFGAFETLSGDFLSD